MGHYDGLREEEAKALRKGVLSGMKDTLQKLHEQPPVEILTAMLEAAIAGPFTERKEQLRVIALLAKAHGLTPEDYFPKE